MMTFKRVISPHRLPFLLRLLLTAAPTAARPSGTPFLRQLPVYTAPVGLLGRGGNLPFLDRCLLRLLAKRHLIRHRPSGELLLLDANLVILM